jgi:hypothetical protein
MALPLLSCIKCLLPQLEQTPAMQHEKKKKKNEMHHLAPTQIVSVPFKENFL